MECSRKIKVWCIIIIMGLGWSPNGSWMRVKSLGPSMLPLLSRHSQRDLSNKSGSSGRVGQRFQPCQGNDRSNSNTFFPWGLGSDIRYAQLPPPPGRITDRQESLLPSLLPLQCWWGLCSACISPIFPNPNFVSPFSNLQACTWRGFRRYSFLVRAFLGPF